MRHSGERGIEEGERQGERNGGLMRRETKGNVDIERGIKGR